MLPADGSQDAYIKAVSILTRAEARVLLFVLVLRSNRFMFQSSPAPRRGCCCSYSFCARTDSCFNPHPRRGAGAAGMFAPMFPSLKEFQSSPAPRRGCCKVNSQVKGFVQRFNPHPRRGAGAAPRAWRSRMPTEVSILTRAEARVLPGRNGASVSALCFNPHPRRGAGAASWFRPIIKCVAVSILTRAEARVLPTA